ncbi:K+/H+ antiporter subunit F, partial [Klebsiella pneumoniae]|nr:K+/H+ antiporter subunit F [Klebsiella pneumoniae]
MLTYVTLLCLGMMGVAAVLNVYRLVKGPDIPDRVLALDTLY